MIAIFLLFLSTILLLSIILLFSAIFLLLNSALRIRLKPMANFVPQPRDRLEVSICNAIKVKDFKQALKLVEKRITKSSDPYLKALKCYVQCCHPLISERGKALNAFLDLAKPTGEKRTEEELELLDESVEILFPSCQGPEAKAICRLRVDTVRASPKDERLALACFRACLKRDDIESAQSVAIIMEKNFPNNHAYQFWRISTTFQISVSEGRSEIDVRTCAGLAYMLIKKCAAATSNTVGVLPFPAKSIQTPQELLLLHRILSTQGKLNESIEFFKDPYLGSSSKVSKGEWIFHIKHLQHLELSGEWKELLAKSLSLLSASRAEDNGSDVSCSRGSDWTVWKALIRATSELQMPDVVDVVSKEIQEHLSPKARTSEKNSELPKIDYGWKVNRRNASLALLELVFAEPPLFTPPNSIKSLYGKAEDDTEDLNSACYVKSSRVALLSAYLEEYRHTVSAFNDVKKFVEKLKLDEMKELIFSAQIVLDLFREDKDSRRFTERFFGNRSDISAAEKITAGITNLKLEYIMKIGGRSEKLMKAGKNVCGWCLEILNTQEESCRYCLRQFAIQALHAYGSAIDDHENVGQRLLPTDKHPADDLAILAAMCLLKMAGCRAWTADQNQMKTTQLMLQSAVVLEYAYSKSKANTGISLLLVRLYSLLGAGSLALRAYSRMGIKQIQGDTLSYILFYRISSLHPHPVTGELGGMLDELDPARYINKLQRLYKGFKTQISANSWTSFENGNYDSVFQLMEVSDALSRSITLPTSVIESRKIDRLINKNYSMSKDSHGFDMLPPIMPDEMFSDNCDYSCFPNFERCENTPFESYIRAGPEPSSFRTHALLLVEELWNFCSPPTDAARRTAFFRLRYITDNGLYQDIRDLNNLKEHITEPETLLISVSRHLIEIVYRCYAPIGVSENAGDSVTTNFNLIKSHILDTKNLLFAIDADLGTAHANEWVPDFGDVLHPIYTAYEIATLVLIVSDILLKPESFAEPDDKVNVMSMKDSAGELLRTLLSIAKNVRGFVNDTVRLDWILDRLRSEHIHKDYDKVEAKSDEYTVSHSILRVLGHQFCEHWAAEIAECWRESVAGLIFLEK